MADQIFGSDKPRWQAEAERVSCPRYWPCPICGKCRARASHLFIKCQHCMVPFCGHKDKDRVKMIRRENFAIKESQLGPDAIQAFRDLIQEALRMGWLTEEDLNQKAQNAGVSAGRTSLMDLDEADLSKLARVLGGSEESCTCELEDGNHGGD